jgi:hypothetical protein
MALVWEAITGLGSVVGLLTGLFILIDRFNKVPTAIVLARPLSPGGVSKALYLRVKNNSDRPIFVSWKSGQYPGRLGISQGHSTKEIIASIIEGQRTTVVEPAEFHDFVLHLPPDASATDPENRVELKLRWRYAQPVWWQLDRPLNVSIPMRSLMLLRGEALEDHE